MSLKVMDVTLRESVYINDVILKEIDDLLYNALWLNPIKFLGI